MAINSVSAGTISQQAISKQGNNVVKRNANAIEDKATVKANEAQKANLELRRERVKETQDEISNKRPPVEKKGSGIDVTA